MSKNAGLDDICQLGGDHTADDGQWQLALANQCLEYLARTHVVPGSKSQSLLA